MAKDSVTLEKSKEFAIRIVRLYNIYTMRERNMSYRNKY